MTVWAQDFPLNSEPDSVAAYRFSKPPKLDGIVDADEWAEATTIARSLVITSTNQDSGEKGQVWIGYDDKYLYVAARIILQEPKKISADEFRDNVSLRGNDNFTFAFNTFGMTQDRNAISFNANGATLLEIAGGRAAKLEWSGRLEARARITATGWEGEARVPWAVLPMPQPGVHDMRFSYGWYVSATGRFVSSHSLNGDYNRMHTLAGVQVPSVPDGRSVLLLPYGYGGYDDENNKHIVNAGLDVKSAVTPDINLVGTFNPDFRNIEGDILNLDFSNFERLPNETRPFFQEGSDYYFFGHDRRIFASQRIPSFDMGANVYGNLGGSTRMGVMSTVDFEHQATFAGSYTYDPDQNAEYTLSFASLQKPGEDNTAGRINMSHRWGNLFGFLEKDVTNDQVEGTGSVDTGGAFYTIPGLDAELVYADVTASFFPRIGFVPERGYKGFRSTFDHERQFSKGPLNGAKYLLNLHDYTQRDGSHYRDGAQLSTTALFKNLVNASIDLRYEHFEDRHDKTAGFWLIYPYTNPYRRFVIGTVFGEIDGEAYRSLSGNFLYRPVKRLQMSLRAQTVRHVTNQDQLVFGFNFEKGKYESIGGRVVYNQHNWNWYTSYHMSGNLGAEYFLILGDPNATSFQKTLILKVTVPISIGG